MKLLNLDTFKLLSSEIKGTKMRFDNPKRVFELIDLCQFLPGNSVGAEIGSYKGESAWIFANTGKFKLLFCIDPWQDNPHYPEKAADIEQTFEELIKPFPCIRKIKQDSPDAAADFKADSLDFVYIDGSHDYKAVIKDIRAWLPKLKPDGIIAGHDYNHYPGRTYRSLGVKFAVDKLFGYPDIVFAGSSWLCFKNRLFQKGIKQ